MGKLRESNLKVPHRGLTVLGGRFELSGSSTSVNYEWSVGCSGSAVTRNNSGSFTVQLDRSIGDWLSGSVVVSLELPLNSAYENDHDYYLQLRNVYLKESGSFDVVAFSGSATNRLYDIDNGYCNFIVLASDLPIKNMK
jgi:hypothetical protein